MLPLSHTRTFRVRYYECNADGFLRVPNALNYIQEAAFDASAAAGYGEARYQEMGRVWLTRENSIEFMRPMRYGDTVEIKTWVQDFRRVRSRRVYEFRVVGSEEMAARAVTDWVFLDMASHRPVSIPEELAAAFFPNGSTPQAQAREPFPARPDQPVGSFTQQRPVTWSDLDPQQHVNNSIYTAYIEDFMSQALGTLKIEPRGWAIYPRLHRIEHRGQARLGDELTLRMSFAGLDTERGERHCSIQRVSDGELVAQGHTVWGYYDEAGEA
ncbi:MAG: thioesterase, partial [Anaerolineae bacterium]|nr:thioesterase [Anaerolineae bacterium]